MIMIQSSYMYTVQPTSQPEVAVTQSGDETTQMENHDHGMYMYVCIGM